MSSDDEPAADWVARSKATVAGWFAMRLSSESFPGDEKARAFWAGVCAERAAHHAKLANNQSWGGWQAREESAINAAIAANLRRWAEEAP